MNFSKDLEILTSSEIATFRESAKKQLNQNGACSGISCWQCRGQRKYNNNMGCIINGWSSTAGIFNPDKKAVKNCKAFLKATKEYKMKDKFERVTDLNEVAELKKNGECYRKSSSGDIACDQLDYIFSRYEYYKKLPTPAFNKYVGRRCINIGTGDHTIIANCDKYNIYTINGFEFREDQMLEQFIIEGINE